MARRPSPTTSARELAIAGEIRALLDSGELTQAWDAGTRALRRYAASQPVHVLMASIAERSGAHDRARRHAERALEAGDHPQPLMLLSDLERRAGRTDSALAYTDRAAALLTDTAGVRIQQAAILEEAGRFTEARGLVDPLIAEFESRGRSLPSSLRFELTKLLVQEKSYDDAVEIIDGVLGEDSTPEQLRVLIGYLKAKALDRSGRYAEAFEAASRSNEIGRVEFDPDLYEQQVSCLIETWSSDRMAAFPISSCDDELPVFIAGMPRSGTSLIDQIIDAHPRAAGVGELGAIEAFAARLSAVYDPTLGPPACFGRLDRFRWTRVAREYVKRVRSMAPGAERVVNKALGNNKLVGLLARLFPKTRVIHALRDPRDVAISCFMGGFNNRLHAWTTRIEWVSRAWAQSERMMEHWKSTLDVPILDVRYEDLVQNPATQFPRLIAFLGLDWDDACLEFDKSRRTVRTLSYDQVNRPLYTTSAGRHRHYRQAIGDTEFPAYPYAGGAD